MEETNINPDFPIAIAFVISGTAKELTSRRPLDDSSETHGHLDDDDDDSSSHRNASTLDMANKFLDPEKAITTLSDEVGSKTIYASSN
jgi:hypothetical protein